MSPPLPEARDTDDASSTSVRWGLHQQTKVMLQVALAGFVYMHLRGYGALFRSSAHLMRSSAHFTGQTQWSQNSAECHSLAQPLGQDCFNGGCLTRVFLCLFSTVQSFACVSSEQKHLTWTPYGVPRCRSKKKKSPNLVFHLNASGAFWHGDLADNNKQMFWRTVQANKTRSKDEYVSRHYHSIVGGQ